MRKRLLLFLFLIILCAVMLLSSCRRADMDNKFKVTLFSDVHHGDRNYNDFACTNGLKKLRAVLDETKDSDCFVNLGDFVDYLKNQQNTFYDEAAAVVQNEYNYSFYNGKNSNSGKVVYNVMGNHEAAFVPKAQLSEYIPYKNDIGSCYTFERGEVLFVVVDANFERETSSDDPSILRTATKFILPDKVIGFLAKDVKEKMNDNVNSIVWLSHIAFKDIESISRWKLADALNDYGIPVIIFEGHTHVENYEWFDKDDENKIELTIYTLPAVTSGNGYRYYNVSFKNGLIENVEKFTGGTIDLD